MNLPILVGEAGGFQDYLFGFGMRMSMLSGLVAAMRLNNEHLKAKKLFKIINRKRKLSFVNRILYEKLNDKQMFFLAEKFSNSSEPLSILSESYKWRLKTVFRWLNYKNRYEVRHT